MDEQQQLTNLIRAFVAERDWSQYHSPKNLSMALSVEVSELVEIFQWLTEQQSANLDSAKLAEAQDELADIYYYLLRLSDVLGIDLKKALSKKMQKNAEKYPADKVRGDSRKYSDYGD
jgi:dCTP diphosphatase